MKRCSKCGKTKSISEFSKRKASPDGLNYTCRECAAQTAREWRGRNPGAFSKWHAQNRERRADYWRDWYEANRDKRSASYAAWARENKHIVNALVAKRNAAKRCAMPAWADKEKIREFYARAAFLTEATGIKHEVDHIYPLQGERVCGLHCEFNLQVLPKAENIRKGNKMPEEIA